MRQRRRVERERPAWARKYRPSGFEAPPVSATLRAMLEDVIAALGVMCLLALFGVAPFLLGVGKGFCQSTYQYGVEVGSGKR